MKTIDLKKEIKATSVNELRDSGHNYHIKKEQQLFESPTGKMIHLVEKLPNGDYYFCKSWRYTSVCIC